MTSHRHRVVYLKQEDFNEGTYRIRHPGTYILSEDIVFEPNADNDFMPREDQKQYKHPAYHMGFFAAVTIESRGVIFDLNGMSIKQSKVHALQQRFFAIIELANTPFIPTQGPGNFGTLEGTAKRTIIKNGILGRSAHHGIHGNYVCHVTIENLEIRDFEVAAIAINGFRDLTIRKCKISDNRRDVPVNSAYSSGRFLHLLARKWLQTNGATLHLADATLKSNFETSLTNLETELDGILTYVKNNTTIPSSNFFAMPKTGNEYLPDGNGYGILAHVPGVAVNDFVEETTKLDLSTKMEIHDVCIHRLRSKVTEVVTLSQKNSSSAQTDVSGSVFRIQKAVSALDSDGKPTPASTYVSNALFEAQLYAAEAGILISKPIGRTSITQDVIDWARQNKPFSYLTDKGYKILCDGDSMFHVQKGMTAIRMDGIVGFDFHKLCIADIENVGTLGSKAAGPYLVSQGNQLRPGYKGADTTAINFSFSSGGKGKDIRIKNIISNNGQSRGIRYINECKDISMKGKIHNVKSGYKYVDGCWYGLDEFGNEVLYDSCLPNILPNSFGILIEKYNDKKSKNIDNDIKVKGLLAPGLQVEAGWITL